jgi:hypothetical protein
LCLFHIPYSITLMVYLRSQQTPNVHIKYFICYWSIFTLFVLNRGWRRDLLLIMIFVYVCSKWVIFEIKTRFETWIKGNDVNGVSLFHISYLITLMVYLRSQQTPNVEIKYFVCNWSIFTLFVLNRGWKRDFLKIMIFVYVCSTWVIFELKTRFERWITGIHGVRSFHFSYIITLMGYLCSQWTPNVQNMYFIFDWSIFTIFVLKRGWRRDSLQIMVFVYVCSTWVIFELKTRFETWITGNDVHCVRLFHLS